MVPSTFILVKKHTKAKMKWKFLEEPSLFKLLPEEESKFMFLFDGMWLGPKNHCECSQTGKLAVYQMENYIDKDKLESIKQRREKEFKHYQRRHPLEKKDILIAQPNIPLSYPIQGAEVMPLHTIILPGLGFHGTSRETLKVLLQASFGNLNTLADVSEEVVQGRGTKLLVITTSYVKLLNHILEHVTYTSTKYLLDVADMMNFTDGTYLVRFPVTIRQLHLPKLFDSGPDNSIRNMVTITVKTFLRYHKLRILLKSIKQYYPDITIIVADDSEHPEKIEEANVQHYIMPFGKGWFAGRNLAISQVTTKYYLWVDDDFIFTEKTKIEKFVDVLENSNLDVVGGSVDGNEYKFKIFYQEGEDSSCLHLRNGFYHHLEGFPNCVVTSGVVNFFLAHTEESRHVGFDPKLQRVAHLEYFMDGLGNLRVGSCSDVVIGHQSHQISTNIQEANAEHLYARFRDVFDKELKFKLTLHYFKNRMKCYTKG
ncbi:beta-1,4 N-acetylgalactosaminyltransferase 2 isoform X1 [Ahaetulla prasina]|uniref:beta-1,4 N-acetylgalactosaminyltransferase 2 isoform X1 n=2 Tax=Ahaetulla prasina TaxID=499056 RepID=UPI0026484242|nr:beta-1,4 N-acetylgalactosaminyltransferase 2 isoform X1 [Ahaetulla prasina]